MVTRTSEKSRRQLETICKEERSAEKCVLTKGLHAEAKELTSSQDAIIESYNSKIVKLKEELDNVKEGKDQLLKDAKLYGVVNSTSYNQSWCALEDDHPLRVEFDAETNRQLKEILTMD